MPKLCSFDSDEFVLTDTTISLNDNFTFCDRMASKIFFRYNSTLHRFQDPTLTNTRYKGAFYDQEHLNYRQVKSILITQNNALGALIGAITATADNVMYWDMPFQVTLKQASPIYLQSGHKSKSIEKFKNFMPLFI